MKDRKKSFVFILIILILLLIFCFFVFFKKSDEVTVTFQSYNESYDVDIQKDGTVSLPTEEPSREGYRFVGWYYNDEPFDFSTKVTSNITLVAKWEAIEYAKYTVRFVVDGEIINQAIVDDGSRLSPPAEPQKDGFTFSGWYVDNRLFDFSDSITSDITLVAKFESDEEEIPLEPTPTPVPSTPTPTPSTKPSRPTPVPTIEPTPVPTVEPTPVPTVEPTPVPTVEPTPSPTVEPTPTPTPVPTPTPTPTPPPDITPPEEFQPTFEVNTYQITVSASTTDDVTSDENLKYSYAIDDGEFQSSAVFDGLKANTAYTIFVQVIDEAGNIRTVKTVVTTESIPTPVIDLIAPTQITNQDVTITLENNSDLSLFYSIDQGNNWIEVSNHQIVVSQNTTVLIRYDDEHGNYGKELSQEISNIDKQEPNLYEPEISVTTNSISVSGTTTDNVTASDRLIYRYQLDNGEWQETGEFTQVVSGTHQLVIAVSDEAGNVLTIQKEVALLELPVPDISVSSRELINSSVQVTINNSYDEFELQCKKGDTNEFSSCILPMDVYENTTITFRYTDGFNYSKEFVLTIDNIDRQKPTVTFANNDENYHQEYSVSFTVSDNVGLNSISYAISDATSFESISNWTDVSDLSELSKTIQLTLSEKTGSYYILVRAQDRAGNVLEIASPPYLLDNVPPAINLDDSGDTTTSSISIKVDATDSDSGIKAYYYSSDGGASWSSPQTHGVYIFLGLKNSTDYNICVQVEDNAGNKSEPICNHVTTNDFGVVSLTSGADKWAPQKVVSVSYQSNPGETYYYSTTSPDGDWHQITNFSQTYLYQQNGMFYFMVSDGYNSQTSAFEVTKIDPLVPEINEITISDLDYNQARLNIDAKDVGEDSERSEIQGYIYDCGNGISSDLTTETSYLCSNLEKETGYEMGVTVYDNAGNSIKQTISVTTLPKYEGIALPVTPVETENGGYISTDQNLADYGLSVDSEVWNGNEYTLTLNTPIWMWGHSTGPIQYTVQFKNDTLLAMRDGVVETETLSGSNKIDSIDASLDKLDVLPGETSSLTFTISYSPGVLNVNSASVRSTVTYQFQGEEKQFIFNVVFNSGSLE